MHVIIKSHPQLKGKFEGILSNRKNWICTIEEIRELMNFRDSTANEAITYVQTINPNIKFEFECQDVDPKDINFIMLIDMVTEAKIKIPDNALSLKGLSLLGSMLINNSTVSDVCLSDEEEICIQSFRGTSVTLNNRNYGDRSCIIIASLLKRNFTLLTMDLRSNKFGDDGVKGIGEALRFNTTLTALDIRKNSEVILYSEKIPSGSDLPVTKEVTFQPGSIGIRYVGHRIQEVFIDTQAGNAGVHVGWIILKVNDEEVSNDDDEIYEAIRKTQDLKKPTVMTFKVVKNTSNIRYAIISHGWTKGLYMEEVPEGDDPETYFVAQITKFICSVIFQSDDGCRTWSVYKKLGAGAINKTLGAGPMTKIMNAQTDYLPKPRAMPRKLDDLLTITFEPNQLGFTYRGNVVTDIIFGSQADRFGVCCGWEILAVNGGDLSGNISLIRPTLQEKLKMSKPISITFFKVDSMVNTIDVSKESGIVLPGMQVLLDALMYSKTICSFGGIPVSKLKNNDSKTIYLDLVECDISDVEAVVISKCLKANSTLKRLNLSRNKMRDLATEAIAKCLRFNSILTSINLDNNDITNAGVQALVQGLKINSTLLILELHSNRISDEGARAFGESLKINSTVTYLDLSKNSISTNGATSLLNSLKVNENLAYLNLSRNSISISGTNSLLDDLQENNTLISLDLMGNMIHNSAKRIITEFWEKMSSVNQLPINWTVSLKEFHNGNKVINHSVKGYKDDEAVIISWFLKTNSSLTELNLYNNNIGDTGARSIAHALTKNTTLIDLNLSNNCIGDIGAQQFGAALEINKTLTELNLNQNEISHVGVQALGKGISINDTLKKIKLNGDIPLLQFRNKKNKNIDFALKGYTDLDTIIIATMLHENTILRNLNLSSNSIGDIGAQRLCTALQHNSTVLELNISHNNIGDVGAQALGELLKINSILKMLSLNKNEFTDVAGIALANALMINKSISKLRMNGDIPVQSFRDGKTKQLDLSSKGYKDIDALIIASILGRNKTLLKLKLDDNKIGDGGMKALSEAITRNSTLKTFMFNNTKIGDAGAEGLAESLKLNISLTSLDMRHCSEIGRRGSKILSQAIIRSNTVITFSGIFVQRFKSGLQRKFSFRVGARNKSLIQNHFENKGGCGDTEALVLGSLLKTNNSILHLDLSKNNFKDDGAIALSDGIIGNSSLASLDMRHNSSIGGPGSQALSQAIIQSWTVRTFSGIPVHHLKENNADLKKVELNGTYSKRAGCGDCEAILLALLLRRNHIVRQVNLSNNTIGDVGAFQLGDALRENSTLVTLRIVDNNISDVGAEGLGMGLKRNSTLIELGLSENQISDIGTKGLMEGVKINSTLQKLQLQYNKIGDEGAQSIADGLKKNFTLTYLSLGTNNISHDGANAIAEALKGNRTLQDLRIYENRIGDSGAEAFVDALKENSTLKQLWIYNNKIDDNSKSLLRQVKKNHRSLATIYLENNYTPE